MATDIYSGSLGEQRRTGASGGVSLTTTSAFTPLIRGTKHVTLIPRDFSTAVVAKYIECPYLRVIKRTLDGSDIVLTDYTEVAQDGSTSTSVNLASQPTAGNGGYLYVGAPVTFRGVNIDVDVPNDQNNRALTVKYWNGSDWADITDTDGTQVATVKSLGQDGSVTWTVPSGWAQAKLATVDSLTGNTDGLLDEYYWTRWEWATGALGTATTLSHMLAMNASTAYAELTSGIGLEMRVNNNTGENGVSGYEALTDAGTAKMIINCATLNGRFSTGSVK